MASGSSTSEWSALEALEGTPRPVAPRLLAASVDPPFLVMEDVGGAPSLASLLLGEDPAAASAALIAYAEGIADLHAVGIAHVDAFEQRMRDRVHADVDGLRAGVPRRHESRRVA